MVFFGMTFALIWETMNGSISAAMAPAAAGVSNQVIAPCIAFNLLSALDADHCNLV